MVELRMPSSCAVNMLPCFCTAACAVHREILGPGVCELKLGEGGSRIKELGLFGLALLAACFL